MIIIFPGYGYDPLLSGHPLTRCLFCMCATPTDPANTARNNGATAERLLYLLKTHGPLKTADLGPMLDITLEATRQQIQKLVDSGLIEGHVMPSAGAGRPSRKWALTATAQARFPDTHSQLTLQLIDSIKLIYGSEGIDKIVSSIEHANTCEYVDACAKATTLEDKVKVLVGIRDAAGYMASLQAEGENWLLIESHCPICVAAQACQGFCRSELQVFQTALGDSATVERIEHLISGDRRCVYRVSPRRPHP